MTPDDPRHGTYSGAQAHITAGHKLPDCEPCHQAFLRYRRQRRYDIDFGRPRMVPAGPTIKHLKTLRNKGVTVLAIAERAGVSTSLIDELLNRPRPVIRFDNAAALLATNPDPAPMGYVPGIGTIRRIRALGAIGWCMADIEKASGGMVKLESLRDINSTERPEVRTRTHVAVATAFEKLCMTTPVGRTASQVRVKAAKSGWLPPLAWDDIDDPNEQPTDWQYRVRTRVGRAEALEEMDHIHVGITAACQQLKVTREALEKWCARHDMTHLYSRLVDRDTPRYWANQHAEGGVA